MRPSRLLVLVLVVGATVAFLAVGLDRARVGSVRPDRSPGARGAVVTSGREPVSAALAVLHDWDRRRSHAYATGDVEELRRLYTARSRAFAADVRVLRRYLRRGLVVRALTIQLLEVRVVARSVGALSIEVKDRALGARAVPARRRPGRGVALPAGAVTESRVRLVSHEGVWLVASVRPS